MQQPGGQTWNGRHKFQTGGPGTTGPPAGDGPGYAKPLNQREILRKKRQPTENQKNAKTEI